MRTTVVASDFVWPVPHILLISPPRECPSSPVRSSQVDGPTLTAAFRMLVTLNVFGSKKKLQEALLKAPRLLCVKAEDIQIAYEQIRNVFEEQSTLLFGSRPDLLQIGPPIKYLFEKLYEMFSVGAGGRKFVNLRLKESVMEQSVWQKWLSMIRESEESITKWIGELQTFEDMKGFRQQGGGNIPRGTSIDDHKVCEKWEVGR